jgi:hypothetical protein
MAVAAVAAFVLTAAPALSAPRIFRTGFESVNDFTAPRFYIEPQNHMGTASHDLSTAVRRSGTYAHRGWIYGANPVYTSPYVNTNHRGYPTIQLNKLPGGGFVTPCMVDFWAWLDVPMRPGEWFSFATLSADGSDAWDRVVLLNVGSEGWPHLMHVPLQGQGKRLYQNTSLKVPMRKWVRFQILIDFSATNGEATAWMNGTLVSKARVQGGHGVLEQAHFGLYAPPTVSRGTVYNDDLVIQEWRP